MIRKVLFVDDDQIMLLAIEKRFSAYSDSFSMVIANDGFEAVQKLKETPVSLIVLDLKMPRMDGMSLLTHTREKYPDIPVIIVSGYRTAEMYKLAKSKGVIAYISKPFQVDDLGKIIMSTLQKEADGGILHNVSPTVFLQLMEMEAKTCTIRILDKASEQGGILFFFEGRLLDARVGELKGIDAAYRVFGWDEVTIFIQNECNPRQNNINSDLQPIIMKAVGMKDESDDGPYSGYESEDRSSLPAGGDDLEDLDLPNELFNLPGKTIAVDSEGVTQPAPVKETIRKKSPIVEIRDLLQKKVGDRCGIEDIYHDESMGNVIQFLTELGSLFDFGELKVGYIDNGKETDRIILPGQPPITLMVNPKCPQDTIIEILSGYR